MGNETAVDELERNIDTINSNDDDDEDEDDEDYKPTNNEDDDDDGDTDREGANNNRQVGDGNGCTTVENRSRLSPAKQCAVDEAFASLFGDGAVAKTKATTNNNNTNTLNKQTTTSSKKKQRQKKLLEDIFGGSSIASKIMATSHRSVQGYDHGSSRKRSMSISNFAEEKVLVRETKRFAGQEIEVVRTAVVVRGDGAVGGTALEKNVGDDSPTTTTNNNNNKPQGIDSLLSQIKGPQKISTMTKTDADWEIFKDHAGLEEELKNKAEGKDAFLVKKDFLDRVDVRKFEKEKEGRERERVVAAAATGGRS